MSSDGDGVVGKIKDKAKAVRDQFGHGDSVGDADADIEYEPTPDQEILHDGMVVLSKSQVEGGNDGDGGGGDGGNGGHDDERNESSSD